MTEGLCPIFVNKVIAKKLHKTFKVKTEKFHFDRQCVGGIIGSRNSAQGPMKSTTDRHKY